MTVRGAGIFGLSIAWTCLRRGATARVIDPGGPGAGSSGGLVGALAPHVPGNWNAKKAFQLESLLMAQSFWAEVAEAGGFDPGYARTGRLQSIADDHRLDLARTRSKTAQDLWKDHAIWEVRPAADFGTWAPSSTTGYLIHDTLTARMHPHRACHALAAAIAARGGHIVPEAAEDGRVVWATGAAGLFALNQEMGASVGGAVKGQALLLDYDVRDLPQFFADTLHIVPHGDGTLAIGSTSERDWDTPYSTDAQLDSLHARALTAMPILAGAPILDRWAGLRPRARSRAPMLGPHPTRPEAFIANGGFKIGFGMAPKVAEVMADLVLDGKDTIPADFRPEASFPKPATPRTP